MTNIILTKNDAIESTINWKANSEKDWVENIQDIIQKKPFGDNKFYIYMFIKRIDDVSGIKKMYLQPRLTKPEPLPGTTLLHVNPKFPGDATIIWTLPNENNFNLYGHGKMYSDEFVFECIEKYKKNPRALMKKEDGDLSEDEIREIYQSKAKKK